MTKTRCRSWTLVAGLLAASACAGNGVARNAEMSPATHAARLHVNNLHGTPITIHAVGSGITLRLGRVLPGMMGSFVVPPAMVGNGPVEFVASVDGGAPARSGPLMLIAGRVVDFVISRPTYSSTAVIRH